MVGMAILNLGLFCFKKDSWKEERGDGSEYPWGYYRGIWVWVKGNDNLGHPS
jgi:hypothetical protein